MKLVDDEVVKRRRDVPAVVPWEVRRSDDALAREWRLELARVRIPFRPFAAIPDDIEHVPLPIDRARENPRQCPARRVSAGSHRCVAIVEVAKHMNRSRVRGPYAKVAPSATSVAPIGVSA